MITFDELFGYERNLSDNITHRDIKMLANKTASLIDYDEFYVEIATRGSIYFDIQKEIDGEILFFKVRIADHARGVNGWDVDYCWRTDLKRKYKTDITDVPSEIAAKFKETITEFK